MNNHVVNVEPSTDIFSSAFLLGSVGAPFIIGMAVGYFAKKMLRTALFLGGAAIVLLFVSEYYGIVHVDDMQLQHAADAATDMAKSSSHFLVQRLSSITSKGVSASVGFFAGIKLGWLFLNARTHAMQRLPVVQLKSIIEHFFIGQQFVVGFSFTGNYYD